MESLKYGVLYINDFHGTKFSKLHFVDDTFLLNIQNTISKINKLLNKELKELSFWLNIIALLPDIAFRQGEVWIIRGLEKISKSNKQGGGLE